MSILKNPFFVLDVTMRDDKRRIKELFDEKNLQLHLEEKILLDAHSILTHPKKRIAAELGWLPGVESGRVKDVIALIQGDAKEIRDVANLPPLARTNLLAAGLERIIDAVSMEEVGEWIIDIAETYDEVDSESTMALINKERQVAGFPSIIESHAFDAELNGRRQYYETVLKDALKHFSSTDLVKVMNQVVETATNGGEEHAAVLIGDLVDNFEVEAQGFFEKETNNIKVLIKQIREIVDEKNPDKEVLNHLVLNLGSVVKNWDLVAQPIQVSARSRGLDHALSREVGRELRDLAVDLFNEHGLLEISQQLTKLSQEVFAEVDGLVEQAEKDAATLDEIAERIEEHSIKEKSSTGLWWFWVIVGMWLLSSY